MGSLVNSTKHKGRNYFNPLESLSENTAEWILSNLLHEASITLIPKLDEDITRKPQI